MITDKSLTASYTHAGVVGPGLLLPLGAGSRRYSMTHDSVTVPELSHRLLLEHPSWAAGGAEAEARRLLSVIDDSLLRALALYVRDGVETDFEANGFSVLGLRALMGSTYLEALEVMSISLSDPKRARAIVTRRGMAR